MKGLPRPEARDQISRITECLDRPLDLVNIPAELLMSQQLSATELAARLKSATPPKLLDVREPGEHQFAALPDSKLIPLRQLPERAAELAAWKDQEVVVYCHHGIRSQHAIGYLASEGFTKLLNLSGGIDAWSADVDPQCPRY